MGRLSAIGRFFSHRYVSVVLLAGLGVALGYLVFFNVFPHKPKIGVIDIPFTVITSRSANTISAYLAYAREDPSIKGVVIRLNSPGGAASASDRGGKDAYEPLEAQAFELGGSVPQDCPIRRVSMTRLFKRWRLPTSSAATSRI